MLGGTDLYFLRINPINISRVICLCGMDNEGVSEAEKRSHLSLSRQDGLITG